MKAFVEERLDVGIDYGAVGGPGFLTEVVELAGGHEHRNAAWADARGRWELGDRLVAKSDLETLQAFFRARRGRAVGFRYRDWNDWEATGEALAPDGTPTVQLTKTYASAGESQVREIRKPVAGTVSLARGGSAFVDYTLDTTTGVVTLIADWTGDVADVTLAAPAVVTVTGHGRSTGETVYMHDPEGGLPASIEGEAFTITVLDADTFELDGSDTQGESFSQSSGNEAFVYVQPGEALTWSGELDVPARFDADEFRARFDAYDEASGDAAYYLASLPVVEIVE